jgi:hypothetical protein
MSEAIMTRHDRTAGIALLVLGFAIAVVPDFRLAGQTIEPHHVGTPWIGAGILLIAMDAAARPMPRATRWVAALLVIGGIASPFLVNLINSSLGA